MQQPRQLAIAAAAFLACAAGAPAHANVIFTFNLPGQSDSLSVVTDGDAVNGVVGNGKYNILDVIIRSSSYFGAGVVGFSVLGGQLTLSGSQFWTYYDPNANFIFWHGSDNRFEINDGTANLAGTYASGLSLTIGILNSAAGSPGGNSFYSIQSWFGGSPNAMYVGRQGQAVAGGALALGAVQAAAPAAVPEPAALLLSATAMAALLATSRRRTRTSLR